MNYSDKKQARIDRYNELADKAHSAALQHKETSGRLVEHIPFGQPILVGHHSERGHRNTLSRSRAHMDKFCENLNKADYYKSKAQAAENNNSISSDDPEAVVKLKEKIQNAEKSQDIMKSANKIIKANPKNEATDDKITALVNLGLSKDQATKLFSPDFCGRIGFASYALTNNNANIRTMKKRLASLQVLAEAETVETEYNGFTVVENIEANRIQIIFSDKETYITMCKDKGLNLKSKGFRYSHNNNAWQRHLNNQGRYAAQDVISLLTA